MGETQGAMVNAKTAKDAASAQKKSERALTARLNAAATAMGANANAYIQELTKFTDSFNPMDYTQAYASLYDSVIAPMERDLQENVMPALASAYSGLGGGGTSSGAYRETLASTKQQAADTKATLRAEDRNISYAQNMDTYNRKVGELASVLSAKNIEPSVRVQIAPTIYGAQTDTIAAQVAQGQAYGNVSSTADRTAFKVVNTIASIKGAGGAKQ